MIKRYYGYLDSPIGILEIVCSEDSLLSAMFVDEVKQSNEVNETSAVLDNAMLQLDEYFRGKRKLFDLNTSQQGTDFQKRVWKGLEEIPYGQTISYKELARRVGNENAMRAVGNANSKNLISIIVPCHRVIGSNGSLTGYEGGIHRKQWLLEHEKSLCI